MPESFRAVTVHKDEVDMFAGLASRDKDPRKSLHVDEVPIPELAPGEALVAVMASAINYNTVWTSIFEPLPTFGFLERYGPVSYTHLDVYKRQSQPAASSTRSACGVAQDSPPRWPRLAIDRM